MGIIVIFCNRDFENFWIVPFLFYSKHWHFFSFPSCTIFNSLPVPTTIIAWVFYTKTWYSLWLVWRHQQGMQTSSNGQTKNTRYIWTEHCRNRWGNTVSGTNFNCRPWWQSYSDPSYVSLFTRKYWSQVVYLPPVERTLYEYIGAVDTSEDWTPIQSQGKITFSPLTCSTGNNRSHTSRSEHSNLIRWSHPHQRMATGDRSIGPSLQ